MGNQGQASMLAATARRIVQLVVIFDFVFELPR
jgi:hypothetical protein